MDERTRRWLQWWLASAGAVPSRISCDVSASAQRSEPRVCSAGSQHAPPGRIRQKVPFAGHGSGWARRIHAPSNLAVARPVYFTLALLGGGLSFGLPWLAALLGAGSLLAALYLVVSGTRRPLYLLLFGSYLLLTLMAVAYGRASVLPVEVAFKSPRYTLLSLTYLVCLGALLAAGEPWAKPRIRWAVLLGALLFCGGMYLQYLGVLHARQNMLINDYNAGRILSITRPGENSRAVVDRAIDTGLFGPAQRPIEKLRSLAE